MQQLIHFLISADNKQRFAQHFRVAARTESNDAPHITSRMSMKASAYSTAMVAPR